MPEIRMTRTAVPPQRTGVPQKTVDPANTTAVVTDNLIFQWCRLSQIHRVFPLMESVRRLRKKTVTTLCRTCHRQHPHQKPQQDFSLLNDVKFLLATCSEADAAVVKKAASITHYKVIYFDAQGMRHEVIR
jgi:hypothetical protein